MQSKLNPLATTPVLLPPLPPLPSYKLLYYKQTPPPSELCDPLLQLHRVQKVNSKHIELVKKRCRKRVSTDGQSWVQYTYKEASLPLGIPPVLFSLAKRSRNAFRKYTQS